MSCEIFFSYTKSYVSNVVPDPRVGALEFHGRIAVAEEHLRSGSAAPASFLELLDKDLSNHHIVGAFEDGAENDRHSVMLRLDVPGS